MKTQLLAALMAAGLATGGVEASSTDQFALKRAARAYRIQVYDTFRLDRPEFDARRAEWDRLLEAWRAAGQPTREIPKLIDWLENAKRHSLPDSIEPLPESPVIVADPTHGHGQFSFWRLFFPNPDANATPAKNNDSTGLTKSTLRITNGPATEPPPASGESNSSKQATPISSKATRDRSLLDEKKPSGSTPAPRPAAPAPTDSSDSGQPTKPAGGAAWLHGLGQQFGEDLNCLAITLAWNPPNQVRRA